MYLLYEQQDQTQTQAREHVKYLNYGQYCFPHDLKIKNFNIYLHIRQLFQLNF